MNSFLLSLSEIHPTQLYVSRANLDRVQKALREGGRESIAPVPVRWLGGRLICTDGHTRAVALHLAGRATARATWEVDELNWVAYEICVRWCQEEGVISVAALAARIVGDAEYEALWLARCRRMHDDLRRRRSGGGLDAIWERHT